MSDYKKPLPEKTVAKIYSPWLKILKRHDSLNVLFSPQSDKFYRVGQFIQLYSNSKFQNAEFKQIIIQSLITNYDENITENISKLFKPSTKHKVIFIMDADWLLTNNPSLFSQIQILSENHNSSYQFVNIFEQDIFNQAYYPNSKKIELLNKNIIYHPLYDKDEIIHFLKYKSRKFGIEPKNSDFEKIATICGGHIWLATGLLRTFANDGIIDINDTEFTSRLELLWNSFNGIQKHLLDKIAHNLDVKYKSKDVNYLINLKLITDNNSPQITIPILTEYILQQSKRRISVTDNLDVEVNNVSVTKLFSENEKKFLSIIINAKKIITREEASSYFWQNGDYSDWALDQVINRLRKKLVSLGIAKNSLKTLKGKGYEWRENAY